MEAACQSQRHLRGTLSNMKVCTTVLFPKDSSRYRDKSDVAGDVMVSD